MTVKLKMPKWVQAQIDIETETTNKLVQRLYADIEETLHMASDRFFNVHGRWPQYVYIEPWPLHVIPHKVTAVATDELPPPGVKFCANVGRLNRVLESFEIAQA